MGYCAGRLPIVAPSASVRVRACRGPGVNYAGRLRSLLVAVLPLSACGSGGFDLSKAEVDNTRDDRCRPLTSGERADAVRVSDETTIRNAVSSADPEQAKGQPLAWANADTGSRGAISA